MSTATKPLNSRMQAIGWKKAETWPGATFRCWVERVVVRLLAGSPKAIAPVLDSSMGGQHIWMEIS